MTIEDVAKDMELDAEIWPDMLPAVNIFIAMSTQWRMGSQGPIGVDYSVLPVMWKLFEVKKKARLEIFQDLRILEDAALGEMRVANTKD